MRKLAMLAAASIAAMGISTAANGQYVFDEIGDSTGTLVFNDFYNTGMSATLSLELLNIDAVTGDFQFTYTLTNTSNKTLTP